jgi:hypothetical protein
MITNRFKQMWPTARQADEKSKIHHLPCEPADKIKCLSKNSITAGNICNCQTNANALGTIFLGLLPGHLLVFLRGCES